MIEDPRPRAAARLADLDPSLLAATLDAVADGVSVQDTRGSVVYANDTAIRMIGFGTLDELRSSRPGEITERFDLLDENGAPLAVEHLPGRRALAGFEAGPTIVGYRIRSTGETRWAEVRASPLRDATGAVTHAINTFHDITDRVRAEADLRASEASYRQLVEAMPQVAWTTDATGRLLMVNARWREYTGVELAADLGRFDDGSDDGVHPEDRAEMNGRWEASLRTGEPLEVATRLRRHDGVYRWHLVRAVPVRGADGEIGGWIGTSTDIEDERRSQARSELLARAAERLDESLDRRDTAEAAAAIAVPALADWCAIDLLARDGSLVRESTATRDGLPADELPEPEAIDGDGPVARALRERSTVVTTADRTAADEGVVDGNGSADADVTPGARTTTAGRATGPGSDRAAPPLSVVVVPLVARDRPLGAMYLAATAPRRYDAHDLRLADEIGHRVALALANAELYEAEQAARERAEAGAVQISALHDMTRILAEASSLAEVATAATRDGAVALGATTAVLYRARRDDPSHLELLGTFGYVESTIEAFRVLSADDPLPVAQAFRDRTPVWAATYPPDERLRGVSATADRAGLAAVPLIVEDRVVGVLGLGFATSRAFDQADRELVVAQANVVAQAIDRISLTEARERLLLDLEAQRNRLETVLRQMPAGVLIADAGGELVLSNEQASEIWRAPIPAGRDVHEYRDFVAFTLDGRQLGPDDWPLTRAVTSGETVINEQLRIVRADGSNGWIAVDAAPIRDRDGAIVAAVSTFSDVSATHLAAGRQTFLAEASAVLSSSLDYEETLARVTQLAVPAIADWAAVDLVGPSGSLDRLVVAHVDPAKVALARELRERYAPDPDAPTGASAVVRTGQPELVSDIGDELIDALPDPELRRIVRELELRSYMAVPLIAGGDVLGVITFVGAESGRRYAEDDLRLAEALAARAASAIQNAHLFREVARFKAILDATLDAVLMFDPETLRIRYVNQGAVDQLGWAREDLVGMGARDLSRDLDESRLRALVAPLVERRLTSRTVTVSLRHSSGHSVPVEVLLQYVEPPGEAGRIVAIARDISDRVEAQARLQRLAEAEHARASELNAVIRAMGEGVVVCDAGGRVVLANPAAEELFPDIAGQTYADIVARLDDPDGRAPRLGERDGPVDLRLMHDPERWVELSTYPVSSERAGADLGAAETIVLIRDVTAARQRQAVRDTFIGVLSHELRTPITTIYAGSKVLSRSGTLDEDVRRSIFEDIHIEAERLHRLVEDVIALRRFGEEDDTEVGREPVLLQRVLPAVLRSEEARWPGVRFQLSVPGGIPTVVADPTYVEQVVRNLLSNAAKYGGPGSEVVATVGTDGDEVVVRILDNGPGFPAEESDRLFDLFFRSPSTAAAASGAGIGLFVCARLIRAMGGRIWAQPRPEGGAEFGFALRTMDDEAG